MDDANSVITEMGLAAKSELCEKTLDMFVSAYGAEAGNLALKVLSVGGLYVGGGIAPRILEKLKDGTFMRAFTDKGRLSQLLINMPVRIILESRAALMGAAAYAEARAAEISGVSPRAASVNWHTSCNSEMASRLRLGLSVYRRNADAVCRLFISGWAFRLSDRLESTCMAFGSTIGGVRYGFGSLRELLAKATPLRERRCAGRRGSGSPPRSVWPRSLRWPICPCRIFCRAGRSLRAGRSYAADRGHARCAAFAPVRSLTVGELRDWLLQTKRRQSGWQRCARALRRRWLPR